MSTTTNLKVVMVYDDASTRNYTITNVGNLNTTTVKSKVAAFNVAAATSNSDVKKTFVSDEGNPVNMIRSAEIITTEEEVIYSV